MHAQHTSTFWDVLVARATLSGRHTDLLILNKEHYSTVNIYATLEPGPVSHETKKKTDIRAVGYNVPPRHADWAGVVSPGSQVYAQYASTTPFHAANVKFNQKNGKHLKAHEDANVEFVPYIIESTGAFHPRVVQDILALSTVPGADNLPIHHAPNITNAYQFWACSYSIAAVRATVQKQIDACAYAYRKIIAHLPSSQ